MTKKRVIKLKAVDARMGSEQGQVFLEELGSESLCSEARATRVLYIYVADVGWQGTVVGNGTKPLWRHTARHCSSIGIWAYLAVKGIHVSRRYSESSRSATTCTDRVFFSNAQLARQRSPDTISRRNCLLSVNTMWRVDQDEAKKLLPRLRRHGFQDT